MPGIIGVCAMDDMGRMPFSKPCKARTDGAVAEKWLIIRLLWNDWVRDAIRRWIVIFPMTRFDIRDARDNAIIIWYFCCILWLTFRGTLRTRFSLCNSILCLFRCYIVVDGRWYMMRCEWMLFLQSISVVSVLGPSSCRISLYMPLITSVRRTDSPLFLAESYEQVMGFGFWVCWSNTRRIRGT